MNTPTDLVNIIDNALIPLHTRKGGANWDDCISELKAVFPYAPDSFLAECVQRFYEKHAAQLIVFEVLDA